MDANLPVSIILKPFQINEFVRSKEVFIISSGGSSDINNIIMELLIVIYACKTNSARKIVAVLPYLPYSRQCKMRKRGCITAKLVAKLLCNAGTVAYFYSSTLTSSKA